MSDPEDLKVGASRAELPAELSAGLKRLSVRLARDDRVLFSYLFGSLARGRFTPLSDVDIAVFLRPDVEPASAKLELLGLIQDTLGRDQIDLVLLGQAPLMLRYRIVRDRRLLSERDRPLRLAFESLTLREGWDFLPREQAMLRRRFALGHR
jgi:predicted nucleotidyltransferase